MHRLGAASRGAVSASWFARLRSQFFAINILVVILATLAGVLVITQQSGNLSRELLGDHMAELAYAFSTRLDQAPDLPTLQADLDSYFRARRIPSSMVLITDAAGTIVASTHSDYIGRSWTEVLAGTQPPQPQSPCVATADPACREDLFELELTTGRVFDMARVVDSPRPSGEPNWIAHYIVSQSAFNLAVSRTIFLGLSVMIALLVFLLILELALFNSHVFRPLEELVEANEAFAEGRTTEGHLKPTPGMSPEIITLIESREKLLTGLETLLECSSAMLTTRTPEEVASTLVTYLARSVGVSRGIVWLVDRATGTFVPSASCGAQPDTLPELSQREQVPPLEAAPRIVDDDPTLRSLGLARALLVPIHADQEAIGVAAIEAPARELTAVELRQTHTFAHYAALALERLRLYQHIQEEGSQMGRLAQLAARLATERDIDALLQRACKETRQLVLAHAVAVFTADGDQLQVAAQDGLDTPQANPEVIFAAPWLAEVRDSAGPVTLDDIAMERSDLYQQGVPPEVKSLVLFRLNVSNRFHGVLLFLFEEAHRASSLEKAVGETLATLLGSLLENAQAFAALQHQRSLLMTVSEVGTEISSILDPAVLYNRVCDLLAARLGFEHAHILIIEDEGRTARFVGGSGPLGRRQVAQGDRVSIATTSINSHVMQTQRPYLSQDVREDPFYLDVDSLPGIHAEMTLPILSAGTLLGMLDVQATRVDAFTEDDQFVLQIVVEQMANAILNARQHEALREQARRDSLTQVLSHGAFVVELEAAVGQARATRGDLSLVMLDIDHFKEYNDQFGHVAGDAALLSTVDAIRRHIKHGDLLGRWGGEEFSIALIGATRTQAMLVANRIQSTLAELRPVDSLGRQMPSPTVSQGIAGLGEDASDAFGLVDVADRALYRAKDRGRNQIQLADAEDQRKGAKSP